MDMPNLLLEYDDQRKPLVNGEFNAQTRSNFGLVDGVDGDEFKYGRSDPCTDGER